VDRVSNYNWESLPGFEEQVKVGAEVINGIGQVALRFWQDPDGSAGDGEAVFLDMGAEKVLELARLLSRQAHEAIRAKWNEENITYP
jgi:hypothetical protein